MSSAALGTCRASCKTFAQRSYRAGGVKEGKLLELHIWDAGGAGGGFEAAVLPLLASGNLGDVHMLLA